MRGYDLAAWEHRTGHRSLYPGGTLADRALGGGLYWLVPTALLGIVGAVYDAWVLLVEIVR